MGTNRVGQESVTDTASSYPLGASPDCPRCGVGMVPRTARRGPNQGKRFWGCPKFPKCRGAIFDPPPDEADSDNGSSLASAPGSSGEAVSEGEKGRKRGKFLGAVVKVVETVDKVQRWHLELDEPDATGRWDPDHRRKVLRYVYERDGGRCGLCAGEMKLQGAHIEHIVPKVFAVFDLRKGGKAVTGSRYKSRLHRLDNLQAAHTYCNRRKGNTPEIRKWRHPDMPVLAVAIGQDGGEFLIPWKPTKRR